MSRYIKVSFDQNAKEFINQIRDKKFYPVAPLKDPTVVSYNSDPDLGYYVIPDGTDMRLYYMFILENLNFCILYWRNDLASATDADLDEFEAWLTQITSGITYNIEIIDIDDYSTYANVNRYKHSNLRFPNWWPAYYTIKELSQVNS